MVASFAKKFGQIVGTRTTCMVDVALWGDSPYAITWKKHHLSTRIG